MVGECKRWCTSLCEDFEHGLRLLTVGFCKNRLDFLLGRDLIQHRNVHWLMWLGNCGPYPACGPHASCYYDNYNRVYFCACDGYYTGNGYTCKSIPYLHFHIPSHFSSSHRTIKQWYFLDHIFHRFLLLPKSCSISVFLVSQTVRTMSSDTSPSHFSISYRTIIVTSSSGTSSMTAKTCSILVLLVS